MKIFFGKRLLLVMCAFSIPLTAQALDLPVLTLSPGASAILETTERTRVVCGVSDPTAKSCQLVVYTSLGYENPYIILVDGKRYGDLRYTLERAREVLAVLKSTGQCR